MSRRGARSEAARASALSAACLVLVCADAGTGRSLQAQAPLDVFGSHSGEARRPTIADQQWFAVSALLLTELDGRFENPDAIVPYPNPPVLLRHDGLQTSAGYNYLTYGRNKVVTRNAESWLPFLPRNTAFTVAWSAHVGVTKDTLILSYAQTALHDFRGVTHNYRPNLEDGYLLLGGDVELLLWPEGKWLALGGHYSGGTFYQEGGLSAILVGGIANTKAHLALTGGWLATGGVGPSAIATAFDDRYFSVRGAVEQTDRYGMSATYSTGIFPDEREILLSLYVGVQLGSVGWLRFEFVNDLLGGKDRGFTGGGRVAYLRTP